MAKDTQCSAMVPSGRVGFMQCSRRPKVEVEGRKYCTIHDPARIAAKRAERISKWDAETAERRKDSQALALLLRELPGLIVGHSSADVEAAWFRVKDKLTIWNR